jgi:hypothetical protein
MNEAEDTNPESEVSIDDVANLLDTTDESPDEGSDEEVREDDAETQPEDDEEVEYEGKTYKVPKELKGALMKNADYTQKTQEVAEQRKSVEERVELLNQRESLMSATFDKAVELRDIQNKLSQYEQIDWQNLVDADPVQATKLNLAYQQLQREAQQKYGELQQAQSQAQNLSEQTRQKFLAEEQTKLKARLPNFDMKVAEKIKSVGKEYGLTDNELNSVVDSRYVHILHDAMKWRSLQVEKPLAMKKVTEAPKAITPQVARSKQSNQAAFDRLKKSGRVEDLAALL